MQPTKNPIKKFVILGGGTAGWMTAATLSNIFKNSAVELELVESDEVGIIGVGEATIPPLLAVLNSLGIDLVSFIKETQASFKLGIKFENWHSQGHSYFHPFGEIGRSIDGHDFFQCWLKSKAEGDKTPLMSHSPASVLSEQGRFFRPFEAQNTPLANTHYALHLDSALAGQYLRKFAENNGVKRTVGHVEQVIQANNGDISKLVLKSGQEVSGDFFIDCSGFKGLLIEETLKTGYESWEEYLPCNRAVTVQTESMPSTPPYTTSNAQAAGWIWNIPLQHRTGNGYVFCDKYCTDEQATETLLKSVHGKVLTQPQIIKFTTGIRKKAWHKNCLSLGLAQGFVEPLESTAIHLVSKTLALFLRMYPNRDCNQTLMDEYNRRVRCDYEEIRDFIVLHYCTTTREDSEFWRWCKNMELPQSLSEKIDFFKASGGLIPGTEQLFQQTNWYAIFNGMEVMPESYNASIDALNYNKLKQSMDKGKQAILNCVQKQPSHDEFLQQYCLAPLPK